jgi:hypothetical protein
MQLHPYAQQLLDVLVPILVAGLGGLLTVVLARLTAWLRTKVDSESFRHASEVLDKVVIDAVAEAEQTIVREFKKANEDGELSRSDGEHILHEVIKVVKQQIGSRLPELTKQLGITPAMIESLIETRIEAAIARMSVVNSTAVAAASPYRGGAVDPNATTVPMRPDLPPIPRSLSPDGPAKPDAPPKPSGPRSG